MEDEQRIAVLWGRVDFLLEATRKQQREIMDLRAWQRDHAEILHGRKPRQPPPANDSALDAPLDRHLAGINEPNMSATDGAKGE